MRGDEQPAMSNCRCRSNIIGLPSRKVRKILLSIVGLALLATGYTIYDLTATDVGRNVSGSLGLDKYDQTGAAMRRAKNLRFHTSLKEPTKTYTSKSLATKSSWHSTSSRKPVLDEVNPSENLKPSTQSSGCQEWVSLAPKPPYFLTAVLLVRIYEKDKAKLTTAEMKMWLQYLRYAGIEHVYIYDAFVYQNESQLPHLREFLKDGYVTYVDWHVHNPYTISGTQVTAYQNCVNKYKGECQWQAAIDIDEYPFSPLDQKPGFLARYMKQYEKSYPQVSELSMKNFLFLGKPLKKELIIERVMRRTPEKSNVLSKPIYKPANLHSVSIHHNSIMKGMTSDAPESELRMNHYWGARLQNWGDDTKEIVKMTIPDISMEPIIKAFKQCESHVRRYLQ